MTPLEKEISELIKRTRTVFITGAGISVASGIPPYRGSPDAVWSSSLEDMFTLTRFHLDPEEWWHSFWLKSHVQILSGAHQPNAAHLALASWQSPADTIITQNIDALHAQPVIEIHGRHNRYICSSPRRAQCPNRKTILDNLPLKPDVSYCELCNSALRPFVLMFDESYDTHPGFQISKALRAVKLATVVVFVGTSFSVGFTELATSICLQRNKKMVNINPIPRSGSFVNLVGPAEEILPLLLDR